MAAFHEKAAKQFLNLSGRETLVNEAVTGFWALRIRMIFLL